MKKAIASGLVVIAGILSGCASNGDLKEVKKEALSAAQEADRKADDALAVAQDAKRIAEDADARARRSEEMLNRGFRKSMYK